MDAGVVEIFLKHIAHALMFGFVLEDQTNVRYASKSSAYVVIDCCFKLVCQPDFPYYTGKWLSISLLQRRKQVYVYYFAHYIIQYVLDYFEKYAS